MAKIGIIPLSAKPYHAGHDGLVRKAAGENDVVHLYVSLSDRDSVSGAAMEVIWKSMIEPSLPDNVDVTYVKVPVRNVYEEIGQANESGSEDTYSIYSDVEDAAANFPTKNLEKYAGDLYARGNVSVVPVTRTSTVNVSGTKMREFLANDDKKSFLKFLPKGIDGNRVWALLQSMKPTPEAAVSKGTKPVSKSPAAKKAVAVPAKAKSARGPLKR